MFIYELCLPFILLLSPFLDSFVILSQILYFCLAVKDYLEWMLSKVANIESNQVYLCQYYNILIFRFLSLWYYLSMLVLALIVCCSFCSFGLVNYIFAIPLFLEADHFLDLIIWNILGAFSDQKWELNLHLNFSNFVH